MKANLISALEAGVDSGLVHSAATIKQVALRMQGQIVYLATPYTKLVKHPTKGFIRANSGRCARVAARWVAAFAASGVTAVSPIAMTHQMLMASGDMLDPLNEVFWTQWCGPLLKASGAIAVPALDGWSESDGVTHEIACSLRWNRTVFLMGAAP